MFDSNAFPERGINDLFAELWSVYLARVVRLISIAFVSALAVYAALFLLDFVMPEGTRGEVDAIVSSVSDVSELTDAQRQEITELQAEGLPVELFRTFVSLIPLVGITALAYGAYLYVIGAHYVTGRVPMAGAISFAMRQAGAMIVTTAMALGVVLASWALLFFAPFFLQEILGDGAIALFFGLLSFTGLLGAVIISAYVLIRWSFIWPIVAFEGLTGAQALRRSWELTEGNWWRIFGILMLVVLAALALEFPSLILDGLGWDTLTELYSSFVAPTVAGPIQAIATFLIYADLRTRKERPEGYGPDQLAEELGFVPLSEYDLLEDDVL